MRNLIIAVMALCILGACTPAPEEPKPVPAIISEDMDTKPEREDKEMPKVYKEILYERTTGDCWVIERSANGLVTETLMHSEEVDDCYQFAIKGE
jgi:hypothetical protein